MEPNETRTIILTNLGLVDQEKELDVSNIEEQIFVRSLFDLIN